METARHFLKFQKKSLVKRSNGQHIPEALLPFEGFVAAAGAFRPFAGQDTWVLEDGEDTYWAAEGSPGAASLLDGHILQVAWQECWGRHRILEAFEPLAHAQTPGIPRPCKAPRHPLCPIRDLSQTRHAESLPRTHQSLSCDFCHCRFP